MSCRARHSSGSGCIPGGYGSAPQSGFIRCRSCVSGKRNPYSGNLPGNAAAFDSSSEFGYTDGLGLIPGKVSPIVSSAARSPAVRSTHIGWRTLDITPAGRSIRDFGGLRPDTSYYFVHSYGANPLHESDFYASVLYGGQNVCAVAGKENIQGVQFHPEKSAKAGLKVLESFLAI